jgi:predicted ATPase
MSDIPSWNIVGDWIAAICRRLDGIQHRRDHLNPVVRTSQDTGILLVLSQRV